MTKIKFPKAPEIKVIWGDSNEESFKDFKVWVERMINRTLNDIYKDMKRIYNECI